MTLNVEMAVILHYTAFLAGLGASYVKVVEHRPILSAKKEFRESYF